jgi:N-acetylglucosamine kinase-like BadF-type ATPase
MRYVLGLDGGGSKLLCVIADETGRMVGASLAGPTNSSYNTPEEIELSICSGITEILDKHNIAKKDVSIVYGALPADRQMSLSTITKNLHSGVTVNILGEFVLSLFGAIQEDFGAIVQAGTGSFANIRTPLAEKTVGGWGPIIGDEGSGYYIGRKALTACSRMADGWEVFTTLQERILTYCKQEKMRDLCSLIYTTPSNKQSTLIASFCPIVGKCASEGDRVAINILEDAAEMLSMQAVTVLKQSGVQEGFPLTVAGGVWKTSPLLFNNFTTRIKQQFPQVDIRYPLFEPVIGGVFMGLRDLGFPVKARIDELKQHFSVYSLSPELFQMI